MWIILLICYILSILLLELSLNSISPIQKFYSNKPLTPDLMRRFDIHKWSRAKLYLGAALLLPRILLIIFCVICHYSCTKLSMLGYQDSPTPIHPLRRFFFSLSSRFWSRLLLIGAGFWRVKTIGEPGDCHIIASNHCSWTDIIYFLHSPELPSFVAKASVKTMPCIGVIATAMQCIFVERTTDKEGALKALSSRQKVLNQGFPKLLVFAEGTTTNGTGVMPFKKGGFLELMPVQPVCVKYGMGDFSPCMEIVPMLSHVVMLACQLRNEMSVYRLPVVKPKEGWSPEEYAEYVRGVIAEFMEVPKIQYSIEEKAKLITEIFSQKPKEF